MDIDTSNIKDNAVRLALEQIIKELKRIKSIPPVKEDLKSVTIAINKIIGKVK